MSYEGFCKLENAQLFYATKGSGQVLVFIHAGIANMQMWDEAFEQFSSDYQVIRYDMRGYGKSESEAVDFYHYQDLHDLLKHLEVQKAHLVAASMGGRVAVDFCLAYPEKVLSLTTICTSLPGISSQMSEGENALFDEMEALEDAGDWLDVAAIDVRLFVDGPNSNPGRAAQGVRNKVQKMALSNYQKYHEQDEPTPVWLEPAALERLEDIHIPSLIMVGEYDISRSLASTEVLTKQIKAAQTYMFKEAAHLPSMEHPQEFYTVLESFLRQAV